MTNPEPFAAATRRRPMLRWIVVGLFRNSLPGYAWRRFVSWRFENRVLPRLKVTSVEDIQLDISSLSLRMKRVVASGSYEAPEIDLCRRLFSPGERILELGGAIGCLGLFCLKDLKAARVVSVEPNPATGSLLKANYELNGYTPALVQAALAPADGPIQLHTSGEFWTDSLEGHPAGSGEITTVRGLTFASLLREVGDDFSAMVVDVEGAEKHIPWGAIPSSFRKVVIEIHPHVIGTPGAYHVLHQAMQHGYQVVAARALSFGLERAAHGEG